MSFSIPPPFPPFSSFFPVFPLPCYIPSPFSSFPNSFSPMSLVLYIPTFDLILFHHFTQTSLLHKYHPLFLFSSFLYFFIPTQFRLLSLSSFHLHSSAIQPKLPCSTYSFLNYIFLRLLPHSAFSLVTLLPHFSSPTTFRYSTQTSLFHLIPPHSFFLNSPLLFLLSLGPFFLLPSYR